MTGDDPLRPEEPVELPSEEDALRAGVGAGGILYFADDASLWRDFYALMARARVIASVKVNGLTLPGRDDDA